MQNYFFRKEIHIPKILIECKIYFIIYHKFNVFIFNKINFPPTK